ncbi:formylglycine-generating enzyme family protein [Methylomarinum vadi]|uniref:formylglycine-generating enzyme family protein n=1 Tax=Methylomarinum vadi TaxID=438855 RepID=UPI000A02C92F|nr:SUMF1/EgtB/PvdO family nonheme iron enzyme [Methylomarinum vadi]
MRSRLLILVFFYSLAATTCYATTHHSTNLDADANKRPRLSLDKTSAILPTTVAIPSGCFQMGSPEYEPHRNQNESRHRVCVKRFYMATHEVTVAEFMAFVKDTNYFTDAEIDYRARGCWSFDDRQKPLWGWRSWADWRQPVKRKPQNNEPVTCVSFHDVNQYIDWLNRRSGRHYRLPTEAEWEYAARAGSTHAYYWGNNPDLSCRYANAADLGSFNGIQWPVTHRCHDDFFFAAPVKNYLPNHFGLYDMLGNVWEWTCSRYQKDYQGQEQHCVPLEHSTDVFIAVRGGGWNADPPRLRASYRNWERPWTRLATWGFRLVLDNGFQR